MGHFQIHAVQQMLLLITAEPRERASQGLVARRLDHAEIIIFQMGSAGCTQWSVAIP
jgi:hypothetical protein